MLEFIARHAIWIALLVIAIVLLFEWTTKTKKLLDRLPEVALQVAGVFLAVALAFEQTNFDRKQQRLQDAQTTVISGAMSLSLGLQDLAFVLAVGYDDRFSDSWFAIPPLVDKMASDEKFLASLDLKSLSRITENLSQMRASNSRAKIYQEQISSEVSKSRQPSWSELSCEFNKITADHLIATSAVLDEVCHFLSDSGHEIPDFLKSSTISSPRRKELGEIFIIHDCRIRVNAKPKYEGIGRNLQQLTTAMDGKALDCNPSD